MVAGLTLKPKHVVDLFVKLNLQVLNLIIARKNILFAVSFIELKLELNVTIKSQDLLQRYLLCPLGHLVNLNFALLAIDSFRVNWR